MSKNTISNNKGNNMELSLENNHSESCNVDFCQNCISVIPDGEGIYVDENDIDEEHTGGTEEMFRNDLKHIGRVFLGFNEEDIGPWCSSCSWELERKRSKHPEKKVHDEVFTSIEVVRKLLATANGWDKKSAGEWVTLVISEAQNLSYDALVEPVKSTGGYICLKVEWDDDIEWFYTVRNRVHGKFLIQHDGDSVCSAHEEAEQKLKQDKNHKNGIIKPVLREDTPFDNDGWRNTICLEEINDETNDVLYSLPNVSKNNKQLYKYELLQKSKRENGTVVEVDKNEYGSVIRIHAIKSENGTAWRVMIRDDGNDDPSIKFSKHDYENDTDQSWTHVTSNKVSEIHTLDNWTQFFIVFKKAVEMYNTIE